ncbi:hypothetical protein D3C74_255800 [compost metagenome]
MSSISLMVRKDILLLRRYLWLIAVYAIIFSGFVQRENVLLYNFLPMMLLILVINSDMQPSAQQFMISLPVSRKNIVLSKYLSAAMVIIITGLLSGVVNSLVQSAFSGSIKFDTLLVVASTISGLFFMTLYIPLFYWIGPKGGQFLNVLMIIFVTIGNGVVTGILSSEESVALINWLNAHPGESKLVIAVILSAAMIASFLTSVGIFKRRDI